MSDHIEGSLEIRTAAGDSIGIPGKRWTPEAVPVVLDALHGITLGDEVTPEEQATGRTPATQWDATDSLGADVTCFLWIETPYEETAIAQAIAQAIAEGETA